MQMGFRKKTLLHDAWFFAIDGLIGSVNRGIMIQFAAHCVMN